MAIRRQLPHPNAESVGNQPPDVIAEQMQVALAPSAT